MFLALVLAFGLLMLLVLAAGAALAARVAWRLGLMRRRWSFILFSTVAIILPPMFWWYADRAATARCIELNGPYDLSCTGELGGAFFVLLQYFLMAGGLIAGPFLGSRLHRRWAGRAA